MLPPISDYVQDEYGGFIKDGTCDWCFADATLEYMSLHPDHYNDKTNQIKRKNEAEYNRFVKAKSRKKCFVVSYDEWVGEKISVCGYHLGRIAEEIQRV